MPRARRARPQVDHGRHTDPNLVATRLRDTPARLYATPAYLKQLGNPAKAADLARADFIGFGEDDRFLHGLNALGFDLTPRNFPIQVANHMALWELVKSGLGIGAIIDEVGDVEPLVERVLPSMAPTPVPASLVSHREVHTSRRVRLVFDLLASRLGPPGRATPPPRTAKRRSRRPK